MGNDKAERTDKASTQWWLGVDLGGTKMVAQVFDPEFKNRARQKKKTRGQEGSKTTLERMASMIQDAMAEAGLDKAALGGIGVGCPGPLDLDRGVVLDLPNLGWHDVPLKKSLEEAFGCPTTIVNDVDAGVYGEYAFGAGRGARCVLGVFPGTGIGGGCVYEGRILRGKTRSCLEIGHIQVQPEGPLCGCGRRGCLEAVASRLAISAAAATAAYRGEAPHLLSKAGMNLEDMRSGMLAEAIAEGDKAVERIVRQAATWLGVGIAAAVNLLAPDLVVLGGGLVESLGDSYLDEVRRSLTSHVMPAFEDSYRLVRAKLGDAAVAQGAAAWARDVRV